MKKIDLHLHTISTSSDKAFVFSKETLLEYINSRKLDAIAITNHNKFDIGQYREIIDSVNVLIIPGIEINVDGGHILVLSDPTEVGDFSARCIKVEEKIIDPSVSIDIEELMGIFTDLDRYIIIPHYDKKPELPSRTLGELRAHFTAGEVSSPKKFVYCIKGRDEPVPVFFSDMRIDKDLKEFSIRQTYVDIGEMSFSAIKYALTDKSKVSLTEKSGHSFFQANSDGLILSTGLNVIIGERSSGKTYTLDSIDKMYDRVKYIRQFSLVEKSDKDDAERYNVQLRESQSMFIEGYLREFKECIDDVVSIDLQSDHREIEKYLSDLKKNAQEYEKADAFSRAGLFSESEYAVNSLDSLRKLIDAVIMLIENQEYRIVIDKYISIDALRGLAVELMVNYTRENEIILKRTWINDLISSIKTELQRRTAATSIPEIDLYAIAIKKNKIAQFVNIVESIRKDKEIYSQDIQGFKIVANTRKFAGAGELKSLSGRQLTFSTAFAEYHKPYEYLQKLKLIDGLRMTELYNFFVHIEYKILNRYGFEVSGGERSEFRLLQEINDALKYDMLLIDEPESSFDNVFLNLEVNRLIKDISNVMPVVIVTHNNTVGASIKPDYIVYTKRIINADGVIYRIYTGHPTDKTLKSIVGDSQKNYGVLLDCLEAGIDAYKNRGATYETLKN